MNDKNKLWMFIGIGLMVLAMIGMMIKPLAAVSAVATLLALVFVAGLVLTIVFGARIGKAKRAIRRQKELELKQQSEEAFRKYMEENNFHADKTFTYGDVDYCFDMGGRHMLTLRKNKIEIQILQNIAFSDIISFELLDNQKQTSRTVIRDDQIVSEDLTAKDQTAKYVTANDQTAKDQTATVETVEVTTHHDYSVRLTVNDVSNPTILLNFGTDSDRANEFYSIFKVIDFGKKIDATTEANEPKMMKCPNCGSELTRLGSGWKCNYCDTKFSN